jgi:hypothetical protein
MRRWGTLAGLIAVLACACTGGHHAATPTGSGSASVQPVPIPPGVKVIGLRHPKRIVLHVGARRAIRLSASGLGNWRPFANDNAEALSMKQSGGYPGKADLIALVTARQVGTANIGTSTDAACMHNGRCGGRPSEIWTLKVKIVRR